MGLPATLLHRHQHAVVATFARGDRKRKQQITGCQAFLLSSWSLPYSRKLDAWSRAVKALSREAEVTVKQSVAMAAAGAFLGPLCDAQHSRYGVLKYNNPIIISVPGLSYNLETCWWVPLLFAVAGIILGLSHPLLDNVVQQEPIFGRRPTHTVVLVSIACFVLQYWASAFLEDRWAGVWHRSFLAGTAVAHWVTFDRSKQGFFMACLTALCGPAIEVLLINLGQLYHYSHPDYLGVPLWIPFVYFCGSPAVGNLGRAVRSELESQSREAS